MTAVARFKLVSRDHGVFSSNKNNISFSLGSFWNNDIRKNDTKIINKT